MTKYILIFWTLLFPIVLHAQQDVDVDGTGKTFTYEFFKSVVAVPCDNPDGDNQDAANKISVDVGYKGLKTIAFAHENTIDEGDKVVIRFLKFKDSELHAKYNYDNDNQCPRYFVVSKKDFEEKSQKIFATKPFRGGSAVTGGVVLLPVKIRPKTPNSITGQQGGFDFSKDVTLGLSIGHKQRLSKRKPYFLNVLFTTGIGSVGLDSFNTEGTITSAADVPALTMATGLVFDYRVVQFGLFIGWDHLSSKNRNNWIYQGSRWYAVGIGFSIFSVSAPQNGSASTQ